MFGHYSLCLFCKQGSFTSFCFLQFAFTNIECISVTVLHDMKWIRFSCGVWNIYYYFHLMIWLACLLTHLNIISIPILPDSI